MMYKFGDEFKLENVDLTFKVLGVFPGGQQRMIRIQENVYKVLMNGQEMDMPESQLKALLESAPKGEQEDKKEEVKQNVRPESGPGSGRVRFGKRK